jgi:hypothetical protein
MTVEGLGLKAPVIANPLSIPAYESRGSASEGSSATIMTSKNMFDVTDKRQSVMRFVLCLVLGIYSFGLITYTLSEFVSGEAACTHCFKGEGAFAGGTGPNGEASTPTNRYVNVGFAAAGPNSFPATDASKISSAINTAAGAWNGAVAEDGTSKTPYNVQQTTNGNKVNVVVTLVDRIPGKAPGDPDACGGIRVIPDANGNVSKAQILIPKNVFNSLGKSSSMNSAISLVWRTSEIARRVGAIASWTKLPIRHVRSRTISARLTSAQSSSTLMKTTSVTGNGKVA